MKLALLAAAWLGGIFLGLRVDTGALPVLLLVLATLPLALMLQIAWRFPWPAVLAGILLLGLLRIEVAGPPAAPLAVVESQRVALTGRIIDDPQATARSVKFVLEVDHIDRGSGMTPQTGKALVYAQPPPSLVAIREANYFQYGDKLVLEGSLQRPEPVEDFDYPAYLATQGITGILWSRRVESVSPDRATPWRTFRGGIFDLRRELSERLELALPATHSALARALLLGLRGQLPEDVVENFRETGTAHLLAISGLHVGVLLVMSLWVGARLLGRRRFGYLILALAAIWLYALISGLPISVVRAAVMGSVYLAALALGRPRSALPALALAAALMVGINPRILEQVSFQLSFASLAGIILAQPLLAHISEKSPNRGQGPGSWWQIWGWYGMKWLLMGLVVSAAATLATWPLVAVNFDRVPLLGILTNVLVLPSLPLILLGSLATAVLGLIHPALGQIAGWLSWAPIAYLLAVVGHFPSPTVAGSWVGSPFMWAWYLVLGGLLFVTGGRGTLRVLAGRAHAWGRNLSARPSAAGTPATGTVGFLMLAVVLASGAVFLWYQVFSGPDGKLHVYFFDVGQGDSILIVTPTGRQVLVDGGPGAESAVRALDGALSPVDRSLDLVVLSHLDEDHSRGLLKVLERYRVGAVLSGPDRPNHAMQPEWSASLERQGIDNVVVEQGYRVELEPGVALEVLNPQPGPSQMSSTPNNGAVVLRLVYGDVSYLLSADVEAEAEARMVEQVRDLESTVLKVAHHGSRTSSSPAFLRRVNPVLAVISSGDNNQFGHPHQEVVTRLGQAVGPLGIFRTDFNGDVEFISDGRDLWVRTQRTPVAVKPRRD
ncbi:MAG: DNA internalization-related competence protein ComEC/Rec2 [Chloroflexi bacterium]|nr:DNA internalization-related competence protein ComEC/Rec2 [Chloroflexota bacterium]MCI0878529.1 DNA internalization-related competence protein ComEC/Rec2 [Chloroflexota bacterium]